MCFKWTFLSDLSERLTEMTAQLSIPVSRQCWKQFGTEASAAPWAFFNSFRESAADATRTIPHRDNSSEFELHQHPCYIPLRQAWWLCLAQKFSADPSCNQWFQTYGLQVLPNKGRKSRHQKYTTPNSFTAFYGSLKQINLKLKVLMSTVSLGHTYIPTEILPFLYWSHPPLLSFSFS